METKLLKAICLINTIYDKTGNELRLTKAAIKTLAEAKDQLKYIIANEVESTAV